MAILCSFQLAQRLEAATVYHVAFGPLPQVIGSVVSMNYPLSHIDGMTPALEARLKAIKIRTTKTLLDEASTMKGRKRLAEETGIPEQTWLDWANNADCMRVKGMGQSKFKLLRLSGVKTLRELSHRNPANLADSMRKANDKHRLVRVKPTEKSVKSLIDHAKKLPLKISY